MQELIKIEKQEIGTRNINSVNARDIHEYLEVKTPFSMWIKRAIEKYDFLSNIDFTINKIVIGKNQQKDFIVTLDMAKELAMLENNEKGKETRKYFISCENQITTQVHDLTPALLEMTKSITTISKNMNTLLSSTINTSNEVNRMKADIREIKEQISSAPVAQNTETLDIEKALQIVSKLNKTVTEVVVDNELMSLWNVSFDEYSLIYIIAVSKRWSEKKIINDKEYSLLYKSQLQELMPKARHERHISRLLKNIVDKGLIEKVVLLNKGYYRLTAQSKKLEDKLEM